jgi:hypothetical protein
MENGSAKFLDTRFALASSLAIHLTGIEVVGAIFYSLDFVVVLRDSERSQAVKMPEICSILMEYLSPGYSLFRFEKIDNMLDVKIRAFSIRRHSRND